MEIPKKNYIIVFILFLIVVILTFIGASFYNNNIKQTSVLYKYIKNINTKELDQYIKENPSVVIYIGDKYDLSNYEMEEKLKNKIIDLNLYNNFIYLNKDSFNEKYINHFNKLYNTNIDINNIPIIIIYNDGYISNIYNNVSLAVLRDINLGDIK